MSKLVPPPRLVQAEYQHDIWYEYEFTLNHANVRYLWALVWPQYPPPENRPRLHNPLGLSWGLKSSSRGPQLGVKTTETAMPELTQMVQSPPCTFWYVFYMSDIGSVELCWTTRNDANWSRTLAWYFFQVIRDNYRQTIWHFLSKNIFCKRVWL